MTAALPPCPIVERAAELLPTLRDVLIHRAEEGQAVVSANLLALPRAQGRRQIVHQLELK